MTGLDGAFVEITIRDIAGRVVLAEQKSVCGLRCRLDLVRLSAGVYFVEATSGRRKSSVKIVKR